MNGTFIADVLQSLGDSEQLLQQRERARDVWRLRFRCESLAPIVDSLGDTVKLTYPQWFATELFDSSPAFKSM
jgi:hypothetical protein